MPTYERHGVEVTIFKSDGADGAVVVAIDTPGFEPSGSDGGPGLRILLNDYDAYVGVPYEPREEDS